MALVAPALLQLAGFPVDIMGQCAVVVHFPVIQMDGCRHISLGHDSPPIPVRIRATLIERFQYGEEHFREHPQSTFIILRRHLTPRMLQRFKCINDFKTFQTGQQRSVVRIGYAFQGACIGRQYFRRLTGM